MSFWNDAEMSLVAGGVGSMKEFSVDTRGHVAKHFLTYFDTHPQIAKKYTLLVQGQAEDFKCMDPSMVWEIKLSPEDLHDISRLERELKEGYLVQNVDYRYVGVVYDEDATLNNLLDISSKMQYNLPPNIYSQLQIALGKELSRFQHFWHDYRILLSLQDKFFPLFRVKIYKTPEALVKGILKTIDHPPNYTNANIAPTDYRDQDKGRILSLAYRCDGVTPELAKYILEYPTKENPWFQNDYDFYSVVDDGLLGPSEQELTEKFAEIMLKFYGKEHKVLAAKLAHTFF